MDPEASYRSPPFKANQELAYLTIILGADVGRERKAAFLGWR
jgi:hypothetical protein